MRQQTNCICTGSVLCDPILVFLRTLRTREPEQGRSMDLSLPVGCTANIAYWAISMGAQKGRFRFVAPFCYPSQKCSAVWSLAMSPSCFCHLAVFLLLLLLVVEFCLFLKKAERSVCQRKIPRTHQHLSIIHRISTKQHSKFAFQPTNLPSCLFLS